MNRLRHLLPGLFAGAGAWCTAARLDLAAGDDGLIRVAMLPPVWLLPLALAAGAGLVALAEVAAPRLVSRATGRRIAPDVVRRAFRPIAVPALIAVPYLPWVPDLVPIVTVLAGPGRWLLWAVVTAEIAWTIVRAALFAPRAGPDGAAPDAPVTDGRGAFSRRARPAVPWLPLSLFAAGLLASGAGALTMTRTALFPGGDEPHYLIIAQSLWRDGDLRIENNHRRGDYREYFAGADLAPHTLTRGLDGEIYSVHPVGLPVLLAPIYALAGYRGAVLALLAMAAAAAAIMAGWVARIVGRRRAGLFAWAATFLSTPFFFNAMAIYPEVPAALLVVLTLVLSWPAVPSVGRAFACGLAIAALPWLSTKYALMAGTLGLVVLGRLVAPAERPRVAAAAVGGRLAALVVPCLVSLGGWLLFFQTIWGRWSPTAPYGAQRETRLAYLPEGGPGLLFDQEYGVVAFAPLLFVGLTGLVSLIRAGGALRRLGVEIAGVLVSLLGVVGAFHLWWGGSAPVGRPLISALLLLALPIAWQHRRAAAAPALSAGYRLLLWLGLAVTVTMALAQQGLLLAAQRDGSSRLLEYLSPGWPLVALVPTYIRAAAAEAWLVTTCWIAAALAVGWALRRAAHRRALVAHPAAAAALAAGGALVVLSLTVPLLSGRPVAHAARAESRASAPILDSFDSVARPWAVRYDELQVTHPASTLPLFPLVAYPASSGGQDERLFGRRLSLPAGRYRVELEADGAPAVEGEVGLQVGRLGAPLRSWPVRLDGGAPWAETFELPIDVNYLGFRLSDALAQVVLRLRVTPETVTDRRHRQPRLAVASARAYGTALVIAHDHRAWLEPRGLWVQGDATVPLTIAQPGQRGAFLTLRGGPEGATVTLATAAGRQHLTLEPDERRVTVVPLDARGVARVAVTTSGGFVPAVARPGSGDQRFLGCWIEVGSTRSSRVLTP